MPLPKTLSRSGPNNFDALRLSMALIVAWSHSFALYYGNFDREPVARLMNGTTTAAGLAVCVFFAISGYLISQSFVSSPSPTNFLRKRIARIYPGYLVATFLCAFVVLPLYVRAHYYTVSNFFGTIGHLLLLQNTFVATPFVHNAFTDLNASLWSIPVEFGCYLGVLAVGLLHLRPARLKMLTVSLLALSVANHVLCEFDGTPAALSRLGPIVVPCFLAGACAFQFRSELRHSAAGALLGVLLLIAITHLPGAGCAAVAFDLVQPPVVAYATLTVAFARRTVQVARIGDLSYGTYLYAWPVQQMVKASLPQLSFTLYLASVLPLSLACGALSWHLVEKWCRVGVPPARGTGPRNRRDDAGLSDLVTRQAGT